MSSKRLAASLSLALCVVANSCTTTSAPASESSEQSGEVIEEGSRPAVDPPSGEPPASDAPVVQPQQLWAHEPSGGFAPDDHRHGQAYIVDAAGVTRLLAELEPDATSPLVLSIRATALCEVAEVLDDRAHGPVSVKLFGDPTSADPGCLTKLDPAYLSYTVGPRSDHGAQQRAYFALTRAVPKLLGLGYDGYGGTVHDGPTLTREELDDIAALHDLRAVALLNVRLDPASVEVLARLPGLRSLDLDGKAALTTESLGILAERTELWRFACDSCQLGDEGMAEIAKFEQLRTLLLDDARLTDRGMQHFAALAQLEVLDLTRNTSVTNAGLAHLAGLTRMRRLWLSTLAIDSQALLHLRGLTRLELLHLDRTSIGDENLEIVATMTDLRDLNLWSTAVGNDGVSHLAGLNRLAKLSLEGTKIDSGALETLAKLVALRELQLDETSVDGGLQQLGSLEQLEYLGLRGTGVDDRDLRQLPALPRLRTLDVSDTGVSDELATKMTTETLEVLVAGDCSG